MDIARRIGRSSPPFDTLTSLLFRLRQLNPNKDASAMYELFAAKLITALKANDDDAMQRILLSRSQLDWPTMTRVWVEDATASSLYRYILLSLLGHAHCFDGAVAVTDSSPSRNITHLLRLDSSVFVKDIASADFVPNEFRDGLISYSPSIRAATEFNVATTWSRRTWLSCRN